MKYMYIWVAVCLTFVYMPFFAAYRFYQDYTRDEELFFAPSHFLWVLAISGV